MHLLFAVRLDDNMRMSCPIGARRFQANPAGHPQMGHPGEIAVEVDHQELAMPADIVDPAPQKAIPEVSWPGLPAQHAGVADLDADDGGSCKCRNEGPANGFDFR
jgi:hypothetical protein